MLRKKLKEKLVLFVLVVVLACAWNMTAFAETTYGEWRQDSTGWWFELEDGSYYQNEWAKIDGVWYFFDEDGYMATGTWLLNDKYYYFNPDTGAMHTGWLEDNGYWYYFDSSGAAVFDTYVDGYYITSDGIWDGKENGTSQKSVSNAGVSVERNTIRATVDGQDMIFYLTSTLDMNSSGYVKFSALSVNESGSRVDKSISLEIPFDAASGSVIRTDDPDDNFEVSYGTAATGNKYRAYSTSGRAGKVRGSIVCNLSANDNCSHVSGTFSGTVQKNPRGTEMVTIENGVFDLYNDETVEWVFELEEKFKKSMREISYEDGFSSGGGSSSSGSSSSSVDHTCRTCHGSGRCTRCGADGLKINQYNNKVYDCYECHGTGKCQICYGTGKVY